jgi:hypothetical protein
MGCASRDRVVSASVDAGDAEPLPVLAPSDEIPRCGTGPWIIHSEQSFSPGKKGPLVGARMSTDVCADVASISDATGTATLAMTVGVPYSIILTTSDAGTFFDDYTGLFAARVNHRGVTTFLSRNPKVATPIDRNQPTLVVAPYEGSVEPCVWWRLRPTVLGHPEARIHYIVPDGTGDFRYVDDPPAEGVQVITIDGLAAGLDVKVEAAIDGCVVEVEPFPDRTGLVRTHPKAVTEVAIRVTNPPDPGDAGGE